MIKSIFLSMAANSHKQRENLKLKIALWGGGFSSSRVTHYYYVDD